MSSRPQQTAVATVVFAGHLALFALVSTQTETVAPIDTAPVTEVSLVDASILEPPAPPAPPAPEPPKPAPPRPEPPQPKVVPAKAEPPPKRSVARKVEARRPVESLLTAGVSTNTSDGQGEVSDAQLANAAPAGSGPSGRACDMARWIQTALRKDPKVHAAVAKARAGNGASPKAIRLWNGDWVRSNGEEGQGLAGLREAIMLEIAFAPAACREPVPMHGLVLISLNDAPGSTGLVVGSGVWRWNDLLR